MQLGYITVTHVKNITFLKNRLLAQPIPEKELKERCIGYMQTPFSFTQSRSKP